MELAGTEQLKAEGSVRREHDDLCSVDTHTSSAPAEARHGLCCPGSTYCPPDTGHVDAKVIEVLGEHTDQRDCNEQGRVALRNSRLVVGHSRTPAPIGSHEAFADMV